MSVLVAEPASKEPVTKFSLGEILLKVEGKNLTLSQFGEESAYALISDLLKQLGEELRDELNCDVDFHFDIDSVYEGSIWSKISASILIVSLNSAVSIAADVNVAVEALRYVDNLGTRAYECSLDEKIVCTMNLYAEGIFYAYYTVKSGDTLNSIAREFRDDSAFTYQQLIYSLYKENPNCFNDRDIHSLKANVNLVIPSKNKIANIDKEKAHIFINVQHLDL
jgi:FimV-like protein